MFPNTHRVGMPLKPPAFPVARRAVVRYNAYMGNTLNIRIPDALRDELQELCTRQHRPAGEVVCDSLRRYLAIEKFQVLRRKTLPFAEAQGILTDEDVFEAIS